MSDTDVLQPPSTPGSRWPVVTASVLAVLVAVACGEARNGATGTLPPIRTTTTLPASATTAQPYFLHYRLQRGETVAVVANAFGVPVQAVVEYNKDRLGDNPNKVGVGTEIVIPPQRYIDSMTTAPSTVPAQE